MSKKTNGPGRHGEIEGVLTDASLFTLEYISPPREVSDYITTLYVFRCDEDEIRDVQPAAIGHLTVFPHGEGAMYFRDGRVDESNQTNLMTPSSAAAPFIVNGPFHSIGAALSPLGWAALTGMCATEHGNRLYKASDHLGKDIADLGERIAKAYRSGELSGEECALEIARYVESRVRPVNSRHAKLIAYCNRWLSSSIDPDLDEFYEGCGYSRRQSQRLIERYFGLPPTSLARKYRALRTAALLSLPTLREELEAEIHNAFYDQSHMIREIQLFVGRTPHRLSQRDRPFLTAMLDVKNFREIDVAPEDQA